MRAGEALVRQRSFDSLESVLSSGSPNFFHGSENEAQPLVSGFDARLRQAPTHHLSKGPSWEVVKT